MAKAIMIQGTTSNAGKSLITAGLCRIFHRTAIGWRLSSLEYGTEFYITRTGLKWAGSGCTGRAA